MPIFTPVMHFSGNCQEALALYKEAFGAEQGCLLRYGDADPGDFSEALTPEQQNYVYHAELFAAGQRMMLADEIRVAPRSGTAMFFTVTFDTAEQVRRAYDVLTAQGSVIYPPRRTSYSSCTCSVVDRFGFRWGLMTEQTER